MPFAYAIFIDYPKMLWIFKISTARHQIGKDKQKIKDFCGNILKFIIEIRRIDWMGHTKGLRKHVQIKKSYLLSMWGN